jgi:RNA polymerase sigma-70 factor (ECF subfamily)
MTQLDASTVTGVFAEHREFLVGVAYRILGRMADAEDVVQEAWLRWTRADPEQIEHPRAFLIRVTTRLAIDRLRRIKARREEYVGPWLPEPALSSQVLPDSIGADPAEQVELAESVSMALLVVLETLSPLERAVFVLREVFGMSHAEVAEVVGRSEAAVRQLAARARAHVQARRPRFRSDPQTRRQVAERFMTACATGNVDALMAVLAPDVTLVADGGGRARSPRVPLHGADKIVRFLQAISRPENTAKFLASIGLGDVARDAAGQRGVRVAEVNGAPAFLAVVGDRVVTVLTVEVVGDRVQTIHLVANPEKLAGLTPALRMSHAGEGTAS